MKSSLYFIISLILLSGCSLNIPGVTDRLPQPTDPLPTVLPPITTRQDAVNYAVSHANDGHLRLTGEVQTIFVQKMSYSEAKELFLVSDLPGEYTNDNQLDDAQAWLVILKCNVEIQPPPDTTTGTSIPIKMEGVCTTVLFQPDADPPVSTRTGACPMK